MTINKINLVSAFFHEERYRTEEVMRWLRDFAVSVCGAGTLGANIAESLARQGFARLKVIDRDRVEERNLSTQPYYRSDIGAFKAKILANSLYRALGVAVEGHAEELTAANASKLLSGSAVVIDTFDNTAARQGREGFLQRGEPSLPPRRPGGRLRRGHLE